MADFAGMNYTVPSENDYWIGLLVGGGVTIPTVWRANITNGGVNGLNNSSPAVCAAHNVTGLVALPDPLVLDTTTNNNRWFWLQYR
jgi:hypothetical protein